jgi:hypothetical protein
MKQCSDVKCKSLPNRWMDWASPQISSRVLIQQQQQHVHVHVHVDNETNENTYENVVNKELKNGKCTYTKFLWSMHYFS